jgi:hypothetical protein
MEVFNQWSCSYDYDQSRGLSCQIHFDAVKVPQPNEVMVVSVVGRVRLMQGTTKIGLTAREVEASLDE